MASIENINQESDYVTVIDDTDDFVQILGVNQEDGDNEIEVSLVEIDGADSIIINVEDVDGYEDVNEFDSYKYINRQPQEEERNSEQNKGS